jgi:hypothetical protein
MSRIRLGRFNSTTVDASETTRIMGGEVKIKRRLRVTRTMGTFFEFLTSGLSMSGEVSISSSDDMAIPTGQKRLRSEGALVLPSPTKALDGPKKDRRKRLLK